MSDRVKFIMLVGIPGTGKTSYAKLLADNDKTVRLSSDDIRKELYGDEATQGDPNEVFTLMNKRTVENFNNGISVIYDATNMTRKDRKEIMRRMPRYVSTECHIVWAPIETCIERDAARERSVGQRIINKMLKKFEAPFYDEGFDTIKIIWPKWFDHNSYYKNVAESMCIPHDNPHHTLNVYEHCVTARQYLMDKGADIRLSNVAFWHDCGKPYTKSFINSKGETTDVAHYYSHQNVGAWVAYGILDDPYFAWLVSTHMEPFFNSKYYDRLPAFLKRDIDLLHEADVAAH